MSAGRKASSGFSVPLQEWGPPVGFFVVVLLVWEGICRVFEIKNYVLPAPSEVAVQIFASIGQLAWHTGITLFESFVGFLIANVLAFACAIVFTYSRLFERSTYPYLVGLQSVPIVAFAPLITLWLGDGLASKVAMAALITFFPMVVNATVGLRAVDRRALDLMHVLRASEVQVFYKLRIPASLPFVVSALKISAPLAVVGSIVAEIAGASTGIGYLILIAAYQVNTPFLFACIVFAALAGLFFFGLAHLAEKVLQVRRRHARDDVGATIRLLRTGRLPSVELAETVNRGTESTSALRASVKPEDEDAILSWFESDELPIIELACTMSANLVKSGSPRVISRISSMLSVPGGALATERFDAVQSESTRGDFFAKQVFLIWRLHDYPEIDDSTRRSILSFIDANWQHWRHRHLVWYRSNEMLETVRKTNLPNPATPPTKVWLYLITASLDPDKPGVCVLVREYLEHQDPLAREVAARILDNDGVFFTEKS